MDIAKYVEELHKYLSAFGNRDIAVKQEQYMRNRFPFIGLMKDDQSMYWKEFQELSGKIDANSAILFAKECIQYPERELWYIASDTVKKYKKKLQKEDLSFIKELIVLSDWWDIVDTMASHAVGHIGFQFPETKSEINSWIESDNFWLRRTAIIYQLSYKKETNKEVLFEHILKTCHEKEFFIRKAIGWALREYSKSESDIVRIFIQKNQKKLSPLSVKEGSKYI